MKLFKITILSIAERLAFHHQCCQKAPSSFLQFEHYINYKPKRKNHKTQVKSHQYLGNINNSPHILALPLSSCLDDLNFENSVKQMEPAACPESQEEQVRFLTDREGAPGEQHPGLKLPTKVCPFCANEMSGTPYSSPVFQQTILEELSHWIKNVWIAEMSNILLSATLMTDMFLLLVTKTKYYIIFAYFDYFFKKSLHTQSKNQKTNYRMRKNIKWDTRYCWTPGHISSEIILSYN